MHTQLISRSTHPRRSLVALGGLARSYGSLASFLALTFLGVGVYIMQDAFADPLAAQATPLVASAFIIALASIILFYLSNRGEPRECAECGFGKKRDPTRQATKETTLSAL
jgi:hypothetical protein